MTVLLLGIPSEPPLRAVADALAGQGVAAVLWNQRQVSVTEIDLTVKACGSVAGVLENAECRVALEEVEGVYVRLTDNASLPELSGRGGQDPLMVHAADVLEGLFTFCEVTAARVVNRPGTPDANAAKPLQAQLIASTFRVPDLLVTDDPSAALAFWERHGRVVYKSTSGERSIVTELRGPDRARLEAVRHCPVQFQQLVEGLDVRVHALVSGEIFATAATGDAVDYRYSGDSVEMWPVDIPRDVAGRCVELTERLGLEFAGIDLKFTPEGGVYCFEVNPSPAFSAYEQTTGQPIAAAVARHLGGACCS